MWSKTLSPDFFNQSLFPTIVLIPLFFEHLQTLSTVLKALPVLSHLILITDASGAMYPFSLTHHQLPTTITWTSPSGLLLFLNFFICGALSLINLCTGQARYAGEFLFMKSAWDNDKHNNSNNKKNHKKITNVPHEMPFMWNKSEACFMLSPRNPNISCSFMHSVLTSFLSHFTSHSPNGFLGLPSRLFLSQD